MGRVDHRERTDADRAGSLMRRWSRELRRHVSAAVVRSGGGCGGWCAFGVPFSLH